jgi:hypothetical protein
MTELVAFLGSVLVLWLCAWIGARLVSSLGAGGREAHEEFNMVLAASLTLLGLIIGFSFSMASTRYDLRKSNEETEANAIGTEYARAGLLPAADAAQVRPLLRRYLDERIDFYTTRDKSRLSQLSVQTTQTQSQLWSAVQAAAVAQPNAVTVLVAAGMNDVLNSQGYTQAAWWNRLPLEAWVLMIVMAMLGNMMVGYAFGKGHAGRLLLLILPVLLSIAFLLIADIDSPRSGVIHVAPQNLLALLATMQ